MSILNRPSDGLVSVLIALCKALVAYGRMSDDDLMIGSPATVERRTCEEDVLALKATRRLRR